jgi:hypothetical protein
MEVLPMTINLGRGRLIVQVIVDQDSQTMAQRPMDQGRADAEVSRQGLRQVLQAERTHWECEAMLRGVGWPR